MDCPVDNYADRAAIDRMEQVLTETGEPDDELRAAWSHVLQQTPSSRRAWVRDARPLSLHKSTILVAVPN